MSDARERIFISYSTKDGKDEAAALRDELKKQGFSVWQDIVALDPVGERSRGSGIKAWGGQPQARRLGFGPRPNPAAIQAKSVGCSGDLDRRQP